MLYQRKTRLKSYGQGSIHLEEESSKLRVSGYGNGDFVSLKDEFGTTWAGFSYRGEDNRTYYHVTNPDGKRMTGVANDSSISFRDDSGRLFKGLRE